MASAETGTNDWYIFGGNRMWHGMASANSVLNRWNDTTQYPHGGYLDDLWHYNFGSHL
jgi:hypothetical protein